MPADRPTPDALTRDELLHENGRLREALARVERAQRDLRRDRDRLQRQRDRLKEPLDAGRRVWPPGPSSPPAACGRVARGRAAGPRVRTVGAPSRRTTSRRRLSSTVPDVRRVAAHLTTEATALLTLLGNPAIDATNWRAEHAIRPAVVTRKVCGGNRTRRGADTLQVLASVLRTLDQRGLDPTDVFTLLLQARRAIVAPALQTPLG